MVTRVNRRLNRISNKSSENVTNTFTWLKFRFGYTMTSLIFASVILFLLRANLLKQHAVESPGKLLVSTPRVTNYFNVNTMAGSRLSTA